MTTGTSTQPEGQVATLTQAYRDLLTTARAYKRERDAALDRLDRLHCAADLYLSSTEERHAERLEQLTDEIEAAQHHLVQPRHDHDPLEAVVSDTSPHAEDQPGEMPRGYLDLTAVYEDGQQVGVRVDHADRRITIGEGILGDHLAPGITFDGTSLTVEAVNGTWTYLLGEAVGSFGGMRWATLVESPSADA